MVSIESKGGQRDRYVDVAYPLPAGLAAIGTLTVKFATKEKARTAAVYGLRLAKVQP